jgi:hypothetical protein
MRSAISNLPDFGQRRGGKKEEGGKQREISIYEMKAYMSETNLLAA